MAPVVALEPEEPEVAPVVALEPEVAPVVALEPEAAPMVAPETTSAPKPRLVQPAQAMKITEIIGGETRIPLPASSRLGLRARVTIEAMLDASLDEISAELSTGHYDQVLDWVLSFENKDPRSAVVQAIMERQERM